LELWVPGSSGALFETPRPGQTRAPAPMIELVKFIKLKMAEAI
jgi:hypothetical protein